MKSFAVGAAILWGSMLAIAGTTILGWWLWGDTGIVFGMLSLPFAAFLVVGALIVGDACEDRPAGGAHWVTEDEIRQAERDTAP